MSFTLEDDTSLSTQEAITNNNEIYYYINPVVDFLYIDNEVQQLILYNVEGKQVLEVSNTNKVDMQAVSKGVYFLKFVTNTGVYSKKLLKIYDKLYKVYTKESLIHLD